MSPPLSETEEQQKAGSSSAADVVDEDGSGTSEDIDAEAIDLMGQGKRNLVVGDPPAAVQCLQEACALLAGKYGEMADECGEAYYQYGCALLELASLENGVLGNALQGVPDESADSDDDDDVAAGDATKKPSNVESADTLEDDDDDDADADDGAGPSKEKADDEAGPSTEKADGEGEEKEDEDDVPNFQLAWEMLELARLIISRQESKDCQLKVSQIHLKLGELGLETEQYAQSIIDFSSCLTIQKKYLEADSRQIAGTHYNLGLALSFAQQFDDSIENYRLSKELIEKRLKDLDQVVSAAEGKGKAKADESDPLVSAAKEMDELKELLPDVVSKLEDAKEMKSQAGAAGGSSDGAGPSSSTSSGFAPSSSGFDQSSSGFDQSSSSAPVQQISVKRPEAAQVSDISHLVRRKRKGADEEEGEEAGTTADSKRSRQEESADKTEATTNGSGDAKAVPNGHANGEANGHANGESNGHVNGDVVANGDAKLSPEKPSEIKTKKLPTDAAPAAMETA